MKIHIVQKGDTLWKIAQKYGVNFEELKKMNSQLSNPDMIMPGMKIKVPTSGVPVTKETPGVMGVKEMPKADHPYANQSTKSYPVTEIDNQVAPAKEMAKKEMPIKEMPIKEQPKKEMPVKEQPKKEAPIALPKLPKLQPMTPEVDINNYYTLNMQIPPKKEKPKEEPKPIEESPESEVESMEMPPPMMPQQPCYPITPITPIMPGCGYNFMPCYPCPPMYQPYPAMMPQMQAPMMQPQFEGMMESPSEMDEVMGMQEGYMPMMPQQPMMLGWPPGCMPYGPTQCSPCPPPYMGMGYQPAPMYMPQMQPQVQGAMMDNESDEYMNMQMPQQQGFNPYQQMPQQQGFNPYQQMPQQQGDCGCGDSGYGNMPGYQPMPYRFPAYGVPVNPAPYGVVPPFSPYGVPASGEQNLFGMPNYEDDED
ncbi:SafA/ExsA family spore coat assembly protein [Metabacillus iocasae]|uniref:Morphogenetic protein associated with SpoVID n=1 Tax=Priestia iocasae TaxID=2291674 RepID=A0ABS2QPJ8_9BACI|nr:SafA/ExsA family spore coat assembly protein [Metabacillus iocasae]MBM7701385.1 morphogenetic protein associated with SpoVID [Metabacillus iocasae]